MDAESARIEIKSRLPEYLLSKGIDPNRNFRCLNPEHPDVHPSMRVYTHPRSGLPMCVCSVCSEKHKIYYDTFDLIAMDYGLPKGSREMFDKAYELFGITVDRNAAPLSDRAGTTYKLTATPPQTAKSGKPTKFDPTSVIANIEKEPRLDLTEPVKAAHSRLFKSPKAMKHFTGTDTAAHERGFSMEKVNEYLLGYAPDGSDTLLDKYPKHKNKLPCGKYHNYIYPCINDDGICDYIFAEISDRSIDGVVKYAKIRKGDDGLQAKIWNERYLKRAEPPEVLFVCEGVPDAISAEMAGSDIKALAFVGAGSGKNRLPALCVMYKPDTIFVIALDNDGAGKGAAKDLANNLRDVGIPYISAPAPMGKDYNESLLTDREAFFTYIRQTQAEALRAKAAWNDRRAGTELPSAAEMSERQDSPISGSTPIDRKDIENMTDTVDIISQEPLTESNRINVQLTDEEADRLEQESAVWNMQGFLDRVNESVTAPFYPTGLKSLDDLLDGGLYKGLYTIGGVTSLGKTTFILQIADNIAAAGNDVLIFSLEMERDELMAKSISRMTYSIVKETGGNTKLAKNTRGIMTGFLYENYSAAEKSLIQQAVSDYTRQISKNIYIVQGVGDVTVMQVRNRVLDHIRLKGKPPVVIIDYLQILAPLSDRMTDKQAVDKNVVELKRISRDYKIPVILTSSLNRKSYTDPISFAAFKESGSVEYSADCLIGLQYEGMDFNKNLDRGEADRVARVRELLDNVKNKDSMRNGDPQAIHVKVLKNRNGVTGDAYISFIPKYNIFYDDGKQAAAKSDDSGFHEIPEARPQKPSKRETERDKIMTAFLRLQSADGTVPVKSMADELDKNRRQVKNMIDEYFDGTLIVDGNLVMTVETYEARKAETEKTPETAVESDTNDSVPAEIGEAENE